MFLERRKKRIIRDHTNSIRSPCFAPRIDSRPFENCICSRKLLHLEIKRTTKDNVPLQQLVSFLKLGFKLVVSNGLCRCCDLAHKLFQSTEGANCCPFKRPCQFLNVNKFCPLTPREHSLHPVVKNVKTAVSLVLLLKDKQSMYNVCSESMVAYAFLSVNRVPPDPILRAPVSLPRLKQSRRSDGRCIIRAETVVKDETKTKKNLHAGIEPIHELIFIYLYSTRYLHSSHSAG